MKDTTVVRPVGDDTAALKAEIARLQAEREMLLRQMKAKISIKLTDKGGVSVYGLGRWPVTLYASQWRTLIGEAKNIEAFLELHKDTLLMAETAWQATKAAAKDPAPAPAPDPVADEAARRAAEVDRRLAVA